MRHSAWRHGRWWIPILLVLATACGGVDGDGPGPDPSSDDPERYAPGETGEIVTTRVNGQEVRYEVIDGLAIFQGDMVLGTAEDVEDRFAAASLLPQTAVCNFDFGFGCGHWTGGVVGYAFADDWGSAANNATMRARVEAAMDHWEANTSLVFVPRASGERIVFKNAGGCSSDIGRVEITGIDPQTVRLAMDCGFGSTVHEIGHAIGLWHEQSRMDRDTFVNVDFGAVVDGQLHQFFQHVGLGADVGGYDYGSIMHYGCRSFARDARNTITPLQAGVSCSDIGQRSGLSEGDILGAYWLYPPEFAITGATDGATSSAFSLRADFTTEPVQDAFLVWRSDRVASPLATGRTLDVRAIDVPAGAHEITAAVEIFGTTVVSRSISVTVENTPPTVDLGADRQVERDRTAFVTATVTDAEDGACPATVCDYAWDPPFTDGSGGGTVGYAFPTTGERTIEVTVTDPGGATGTDSVVLDVIDSPPVPVIASPSDGTDFALAGGGTIEIPLNGSATDANEGPGPGAGTLACSRLAWSVTGTGASITPETGCSATLTATQAGPLTVTLTAQDSVAQSAETSVDVTVTTCVGNCAPNASFVITSEYGWAPESVYWLSSPISVTATIGDPDVPPNNPIAYAWVLDPPFSAPDIVLETGTVVDPDGAPSATLPFTFTPGDHVDPWSNCTLPGAYLDHWLRLEVEDDLGGTHQTQQTVKLGCSLD